MPLAWPKLGAAVVAVGRAIETWMTKEALAACGNPLAVADIDAESAAALSLGALTTNPDPGKARLLSSRADFQAWTQAQALFCGDRAQPLSAARR
eukprot:COSAG04_NODE_11202_length_724_cov_0.696000_2_plen_95_part_00